jgi:acyl transferase domain-containing protein
MPGLSTPASQDGAAALAGAPREAAGVYVGCVWQEYPAALERARVAPSVAVLTGSGLNFMAGRVSYTFGLQGACELAVHARSSVVDSCALHTHQTTA